MTASTKRVPVELLLEIVRFIQFDRKWAHLRVSNAFDQLLLEHMGNFLRDPPYFLHINLNISQQMFDCYPWIPNGWPMSGWPMYGGRKICQCTVGHRMRSSPE
uniref:F-box domain-containing protein n=1 Tax=Globodera rostochiensis TaxID=31243 RepID=A0A914GW26_GLORO